MVNQHNRERVQTEAYKIIENAIKAAALTIAGLTIASVTAKLLIVLGSTLAVSSAPALSSYIASKVPGFVAGTSAAVVKFQPQIERTLKPIAEKVIETFKNAA